MKTVIIQVLYGKGIWSHLPFVTAKTTSQMMEKHLIPSVQNYAKRHGYSYRLHRPDSLHFQLFAKDTSNATLEIYHVANTLSHLYDRLILIDCDIYTRPHAPAMPLANAVAAGREYPPHIACPYTPDENQFNSGLIVMNSHHASTFYNYLKTTKPDPRFTSDQHYFCTWSLKNKVHLLEEKWNYMLQNKPATPLKDAFFIHYAGRKKYHIIRDFGSPSSLLFYRNEMLLRMYSFITAMVRMLRRTNFYQRLRQFKNG